MPDLNDGATAEVQGSAAKPYLIKNVGGVYSCSCPAWRNQSLAIDVRTCKHLRQFRGEEAERQRLGQSLPPSAAQVIPKTKPAAPALLLAQTWDSQADLTGWWISEKLDGVRGYWDGHEFYSRQGNKFYSPASFTAGLPPIPLDGELWLGRRQFQRTVSIVRRQAGGELWHQLKFVVFDAPACVGGFEQRIAELEQHFEDSRPRFACVLRQERCRSAIHLRVELERVNALGGEGLMLREPDSRYEAGRSNTLLKAKRFQDAEARVVGHQPGLGRHKGRLGALLAMLPDGTEFSVGTGLSDAERNNPPPIGSMITFRYQELTNGGVPRFPSFVRLRQDA